MSIFTLDSLQRQYALRSAVFGLTIALLVYFHTSPIAGLALIAQVIITIVIRLRTGPMLFCWFLFVPQLSARQAAYFHVHIPTDIGPGLFFLQVFLVMAYLLATCRYLSLTTTLVLREYSEEETKWGVTHSSGDTYNDKSVFWSSLGKVILAASLLIGLSMWGEGGGSRSSKTVMFSRYVFAMFLMLLVARKLKTWRGANPNNKSAVTEQDKVAVRLMLMDECWKSTWVFQRSFWNTIRKKKLRRKNMKKTKSSP